MYNREIEAEIFGGKGSYEMHNKRMKAAARERLKRNVEWNHQHKSKKNRKDSEE